jgi:hypothetical protein
VTSATTLDNHQLNAAHEYAVQCISMLVGDALHLADPCVAARHVIGRLLDLSRIS